MPKTLILMVELGDEGVLVFEGLKISIQKTWNGVALGRMDGEIIVAKKEILELVEERDWVPYEVIGHCAGSSLFHCFAMAFRYRENFFEEVCAYSLDLRCLEESDRYDVAIIAYGKVQLAN